MQYAVMRRLSDEDDVVLIQRGKKQVKTQTRGYKSIEF